MAHQTSTAKDKSEDGLHFQSDLLWFLCSEDDGTPQQFSSLCNKILHKYNIL